MEQQPMQQALTGDQDEASWSLYDFVEINDKFNHREDNIIHGNVTSIALYSSPRGVTTEHSEDDWKRIGTAMTKCIKLKELNLGSIKLTKQVAKYLFENRGQHTWPELDVFKMYSGVRELRALLPTLKSFPSLDTLDLSQCRGLGIQAAKLVGGLLNQTKISKLLLDSDGHYRSNNQNLKDDGLKCILEASNAKYITRLSVGGGYTHVGYETLTSFIRKDDIQLEVLGVTIKGDRTVSGAGMSFEDIQCMFIESIQNKSKLESITLSESYSTPRDIVLEKLFNLVCNTETIQSVIDSNHKFRAIGYGYSEGGLSRDDSKELTHAFEINRVASDTGSTAKAIRRKVRSFYFQKPEFDVTSFVDMDANLLPYVLDLVTRIEFRDDQWLDSRWSSIDSRWSKKKEPFLVPSYNNLNGIYRLVKNCPVSLFSFPSPRDLLTQKDDLLKQKDDTILQLKAEMEEQRLRMEEQAREIELLKKGGPTPSNKRAKTGDDKTKSGGGDIESRLATLEADVALLKQK